MRLRRAVSCGPRARDEPLQLPVRLCREIDALVTGGGGKQRVLHVQHVQLGAAVPGETRREDERHPRRIREADGSQDGSRGNHSLTSEGRTGVNYSGEAGFVMTSMPPAGIVALSASLAGRSRYVGRPTIGWTVKMRGRPESKATSRPLWTCPKCGLKFVTKNLWHSCGRATLADWQQRMGPRALGLYKKFERLVSRCGPYHVSPAKTRIAFSRAGALRRRHAVVRGRHDMRVCPSIRPSVAAVRQGGGGRTRVVEPRAARVRTAGTG